MTNPIKDLPKIIETARVRMHQLPALPEHAMMIFDAVRDLNPDDYKYIEIGIDNIIPTSEREVFEFMELENSRVDKNGICLYMVAEDRFIGYRRVHYFGDATRTFQMSSVWLVRDAWGRGYAAETYRELEKIAFDVLGANRITRQCSVDNIRSKKSIQSAGFHLDGISRMGGVYHDGTLYDNMMWSKLKSEYDAGK